MGFDGGDGFGSVSDRDRAALIARDPAKSSGNQQEDLSKSIASCKELVNAYGKCGMTNKQWGGIEQCDYWRGRLEESCGLYKNYWEIWWDNELKPKYCEEKLAKYFRIRQKWPKDVNWVSEVRKDLEGNCDYNVEKLEEICQLGLPLDLLKSNNEALSSFLKVREKLPKPSSLKQ